MWAPPLDIYKHMDLHGLVLIWLIKSHCRPRARGYAMYGCGGCNCSVVLPMWLHQTRAVLFRVKSDGRSGTGVPCASAVRVFLWERMSHDVSMGHAGFQSLCLSAVTLKVSRLPCPSCAGPSRWHKPCSFTRMAVGPSHGCWESCSLWP